MGCDRNTIFFGFNVISIILGITAIVLGALAINEVSSLKKDYTKPLLDPILYDANQAGKLVFDLFILIIVIGAHLVVVALIGFISICCEEKRKRVLSIYGVFCALEILFQIAVIVLWIEILEKIEGEVKEKLILALKENFIEDTTSNIDPISNAWNHMFMELDCCGVDPVIYMSNEFDQTPWCTTQGSCQSNISQIPKTCCVGADESMYSSALLSCHENVTIGTYNAKGCYKVLKDKLLLKIDIIFIPSIFLLTEIISGILASVICCKCGKCNSRGNDRPGSRGQDRPVSSGQAIPGSRETNLNSGTRGDSVFNKEKCLTMISMDSVND